jgi:hypothetical protein
VEASYLFDCLIVCILSVCSFVFCSLMVWYRPVLLLVVHHCVTGFLFLWCDSMLVLTCSHMVPGTQPTRAFHMIKAILNGTPLWACLRGEELKMCARSDKSNPWLMEFN